MKGKVIIPLQSFGLGDILFCISMAYEWLSKGYHVLWGVDAVYLPIAKHFPRIVFIDKKHLAVNYNIHEITTVDNATIVPIRWSDSIQKVPYNQVMRAKYDMLGMKWENWKNNFFCQRDMDAECRLYYEVLGLKDGEEYILTSCQFGTGGSRRVNVVHPDSTDIKMVELKFIEGYTLIDWLMVIERASVIHAVASSNIYLFELYELTAKEVHLYPRWPIERTHDNYQYLLTKNYILH